LIRHVRRGRADAELIAVRVRDDHEPVAPLAVFHIHAALFQLRAQGIQHAGIERDEHQPFAHFIGPLARKNKLAAAPVDLRDPRFPLVLISPRRGEPERLRLELCRPFDVRHEQHRPRVPFIAHDVLLPARRDRLRRSIQGESSE
jgi:hypothetical protein